MGGNREARTISDAYRYVDVRPQGNEGGPVQSTTVGSVSSTIGSEADGFVAEFPEHSEQPNNEEVYSKWSIAVTITNMTSVKLNYG